MTLRASLVQDVWIGAAPRLRARRLAPFEEPRVRLLFHPDYRATLDDPLVAAFLEALGEFVEVVALEPREHGGSDGRFGVAVLEDWRRLVDEAPRRWPDGIPIALCGHGLGASLALGASDRPQVRAIVALSPASRQGAPPELAPVLEAIGPPERTGTVATPMLVVAPRRASADPLDGLAAAVPHASIALVPGDESDLLRPPWPHVVARWVEWAAATEAR